MGARPAGDRVLCRLQRLGQLLGQRAHQPAPQERVGQLPVQPGAFGAAPLRLGGRAEQPDRRVQVADGAVLREVRQAGTRLGYEPGRAVGRHAPGGRLGLGAAEAAQHLGGDLGEGPQPAVVVDGGRGGARVDRSGEERGGHRREVAHRASVTRGDVLGAVLEHQGRAAGAQLAEQFLADPVEEGVGRTAAVVGVVGDSAQQSAQQHLRQHVGAAAHQHGALDELHHGQHQRYGRQIHGELGGRRGRGSAERPYTLGGFDVPGRTGTPGDGRVVRQDQGGGGVHRLPGRPRDQPGPGFEGRAAQGEHGHRETVRRTRPAEPRGELQPSRGPFPPSQQPGPGRQVRPPPHALGQRLDDGDRCGGGPAVQQALHPAAAPQRARAVAEHHGQLTSGGIAELGGGGGVLADAVDGHFAEGSGAFADLAQLVQRAVPDDVRGRLVHHESEPGLAPPGGAEHGDHQAGVGGAVGRGDLVQLTAQQALRRAVALEGPQGALQVEGVRQRRGGRYGNPACAVLRYCCGHRIRLGGSVQSRPGPRRRSRAERRRGRLLVGSCRRPLGPWPRRLLGGTVRGQRCRSGRHVPREPQRIRQLLGGGVQFRLAETGDQSGQGRVHGVTAAGCRAAVSAVRRSRPGARAPPARRAA